jgi:hypothetical protein
MSGIVIPIRKDCIFQEKTIFFFFLSFSKKKKKKKRKKKKKKPQGQPATYGSWWTPGAF